MNNIILTTTDPSFFGGIFDDEETRKERTNRTKIISDKYNNGNLPSNTNKMSVYYQGELEDVMGYDIPCLINGEMPELQYGDIIPVTAITLNDKSYDAVMLVGQYDCNEGLYALIMTYNDAETFLSGIKVEAECGEVSFDKLIETTHKGEITNGSN